MNKYFDEIFSLKGQVAIVTGGAMGIGKGISISLAKAGANVLIADIAKATDVNSTINELKEINPACSYMQVDLRNISLLSSVTQKAVELYGDLNILVNNAGIFKYRPMMEMDESMWDSVVDLNLKSLAFLSREAAKVMQTKGHGGRIINITSIDAIKPVAGNLAHYDSSKAAVRMFTRSFAKEVASLGILVNDIAPGGVNTPGAKTISGDNPSAEQLKAMEQQTGKCHYQCSDSCSR